MKRKTGILEGWERGGRGETDAGRLATKGRVVEEVDINNNSYAHAVLRSNPSARLNPSNITKERSAF